jgi:hypothetical protein
MDRRAFEALVQNAERAVERILPILSESIGGDVRSLIRLCRQDETEVFGQCREIGWLALRIVESARLAQRPELAEAAKGVWEMIDALSSRGVWHTDALILHADALEALSSEPPMDAESIAAMLRALLAMRTAIGAAAAP